jgi:hypothetical protein
VLQGVFRNGRTGNRERKEQRKIEERKKINGAQRIKERKNECGKRRRKQ